MPGSFKLEIVTPMRLAYEGEVSAIQAPGLDGYFGVLHNRAPLIAALGPGEVTFQEVNGPTRHLAIAGGFFQVARNRAVLLADEAVFAADIDRAAVERDLQEATAQLTGRVTSDEERLQLQRTAAVARAKLKVAGRERRG